MSDETPAGWHRDPYYEGDRWRYWDGTRWTEHVSSGEGGEGSGWSTSTKRTPAKRKVWIAVGVAAAVLVGLGIVGALAGEDEETRSDGGEGVGTDEPANSADVEPEDDASQDLDQYLVEFCASTGAPWCAQYIGVTVEGDTATAEVSSDTTQEAAESLCSAIGATIFSNDPVVDASTTRVVLPDGQTLVERVGIADRCDPTEPTLTDPAPVPGAGASGGVMPAIPCGFDLQAAQDLVQDSGVFFSTSEDATGQGRNQIVDNNWTVVGQEPAPGTPIGEGEAVFYVVKDEEFTGC